MTIYKKLFLFLIFLHVQVLFAQNIKEVLIVSENWDTYTNKDGSGLYFDIVRMIYEPLGIKVKIKIYPYNRSSKMVERKLADAWLGSYIYEEDYALYPKYFFDKDIVTAMFKKERFPNFKGIKSLENREVCWIRGYGMDEYIDINLKKHERNDRKSILLSLEKDRFDIFLDDKFDMQDAIKKLKFDASKYHFVELLKFKLYPAFRNDAKGERLRSIWDEQFKKYLDDGSLKKLYIKNDHLKAFWYGEILNNE